MISISTAYQVVRSLKSKHPDLLRSLPSPRTVGANERTEPPSLPGLAMMPVRLVTNGLWPATDSATYLSGAAHNSKRPWGTIKSSEQKADKSRKGSSAARKGEGETPGKVSASTLATEIAELFDSVSVALNTSDSEQYDQVSDHP